MANIEVKEATGLVKSYYTDYAKYVLETRALPSIYDGFKHAQRRLLYTGSKLPQKFNKSANILGQTIPYHPHGIDSLYGTLVGMTSPNSNFRLFKGKGNWGGFGFGAAAFRYTEAYVEAYAKFCYTQFVDSATVIQGESGLDEPESLPALIPYSNVVGSSGIGVGFSTNIMPLNIMELIDYYIARIKGETNAKVPTPDIGNYVLDMTDDEINEAVLKIDGRLVIKSIITQESDNILVIEGIYGKSISKVLDRLGDLLDSGKIDFRDESSTDVRYVIEIYSNDVNIKELTKTISAMTTARSSFTRLVVDKDTAVYCSLDHQVNKTLEYLNKVLDTKFATELVKLQNAEKVFMTIEHLKTSGLISKLSSMDTDQLKDQLVKDLGYDRDIISTAVSKPITYLTKSHMKELQDIRDAIKSNKATNRTDYLIKLYTDFKEMIRPIYDQSKHTIRKSQLLTTPRVSKSSGDTLLVSNKGLDFESNLVAVFKDSTVIPMNIFSQLKREIKLDSNELVDIATDKTADVVVMITNKGGIVANEYNNIKYAKKTITLDDDEFVYQVLRVKRTNKGATFKYGNMDYNADNYIRVKVSKPIRNWTL